LARIGIGAVVDLRAEGKDDETLMAQHDIRFLHLPVRDRWPPSQAQMVEGAEWVLTQMGEQRKTLVHCKEGIGRSVTLACCVLMRQGHDLASAVRLVRARRWGAALNRRHLEGLLRYAEQVNPTAPRPPGDEEAGSSFPGPPA
jgi:protein-tyrosine phosphatase